MQYPCSTGEAARLLGTTEPRLSEAVRRGRLKLRPRVVAGRRLWEPEHLIEAARSLGILTNHLERSLRIAAAGDAEHAR